MATKLWTGNALAVPQIQTYAPGQQLPNTTISATINGKTASYTSATGTNDDLIAGLITAVLGIVNQAPEFAEVTFAKTAYNPAVPSPNSTYLQMSSKAAGTPFTVTISLSTPAKVTVTRTTAGQAGVNELQKITISPNAESGSSFTLTWGGSTTNAIPTPASAPTSATGSSGVLTGGYLWAVTFVTAKGETELGLPSASLTLSAQQASLSGIPLGPTGTTKRRIYRTKAGGTAYFLVTTIGDNTTTIYTDNATDATIGANPGPPATNGCLQGELEALSSIGNTNVKVGGANVAAVSGQTMPTSAIVYTVEFRGTLGNASQALISGNVTNVTILPTVSIATVTTGCPPQSEIQTVGWQQVVGVVSPTGGFTITLPGLNVTTAAIVYNASAATVQAALVAAAGPAYANAFSVALTQQTAAGYLWQITYQGPLALQSVPLATVNVANVVAAAGDTVTGYQAETQKGTATGRNSVVTVTLNNGPTGGTFGLTGTLANGSTISATGIAYNAPVATLAAAFSPANTTSIGGNAGGPFTIECVGEAGTQNVTWSATSSLSGGGTTPGSPPGSNSTGIATPSVFNLTPQATSVNALPTATYYFVLTAFNSSGETLPTSEGSINVAVANSEYIQASWSAVSGATGYKLYWGTSPGGENKYFSTSGTSLAFNGSVYASSSSGTPPGSSSAGALSAPVQSNATPTTGTGSLASGTYYYEITATNSSGETTASNEKSATLSSTGEITLAWATVTGANGYKVYRGTSTGAENVLVAIVSGGSSTGYVDNGVVSPAAFAAVELVKGAAAVNEVQTVTISGATGGTFNLAFEGQQTGNLPYNDTSADVQTQLQALSSVGSGNLTVSGSAGGPFTVTAASALAGLPLPLIAANGTNLTGTSTNSQTLTTTQAATGPNFWDNAQNWSPTGVPANGDSVYFQNSNVDCLYNLSQSSTTLANLQIDMSFVNGEIGLPSWNGKYFEYRQQYLQIGVSGTILIGSGKGSGPTLIKLDTGTNATTMLVNNCGTSLDPTLPAILWKGNRSSGTTTLNVTKGSIGIAVFAGETATVDQINQGYVTNVNSDSSVYVGPGTTINTQWYMTGGIGTLNAACPSLTMENGTLTILDGLSATSVTTLSVVGGTVSDRSTGLITTLTVGTGATYDRSDDARAKTVTNATISGKATLLDPNDTISFSNPLILSDCSLLDVTLDLGTNITVQRTASGVAPSSPLQNNAIVQGRLTLSSTLPVTLNDVTGAGTLYFLPFRGDKVSLFNGSYWQSQSIPAAGVSLSLTGLTASTLYDAFLFNNNGTLTLQAVAWASSGAGTGARATTLTLQNGIYVKNGSPGYLYLGTFYTTGTGTTEDSFLNRLCWNYYNRVDRPMERIDSTSTWTYNTATWRQANASTANQITAVIGVSEESINLTATQESSASGNASATVTWVGIGTNSTTAPDAKCLMNACSLDTLGTPAYGLAQLRVMPPAGYNVFAWLEKAGAQGGTTYTFAGSPGTQIMGIMGTLKA